MAKRKPAFVTIDDYNEIWLWLNDLDSKIRSLAMILKSPLIRDEATR